MLQPWVVVMFIALVPAAHPFKSNSSITIYHLVDEMSTYIRSELRQKVAWQSGNHFIGVGHRFAIHDRYCGDFSTLDLLEEPSINATFQKRTETMVYQCDVVLYLKALFFGFILDINIGGQNFESSNVKIHAKDNAWEIIFEVHVREDGFCKIKFLDSAILYLGDYEIVIEPQNHFVRKWTIWLITRGIVWGYYETWNEMLKGTMRDEFKSEGLNEVICKAFTSRQP